MNDDIKVTNAQRKGRSYLTEVENLQKYLRQLSFSDRDITSVPVDGIWGSATKDAVRTFQRKNRLDPTGTVNKETWDRIYSEYKKDCEKSSPPLSMPIFPRIPRGYYAEKGAEGFLVHAIQYMLNEVMTSYSEFTWPPIAQDGIYGTDTENAVSAYQKFRGLNENGNMDILTWNDLVRLYTYTFDRSE